MTDKKPYTHMCPVGACDWYGYDGDECPKQGHGQMVEIPPSTRTPGRDVKPTNPKDIIGSDKLPLHLVPEAVEAYATLAFLEGALKYGRFNWRIAGVRFSIYLDALERHYKKLKAGEWEDQKTRVPHLASIIACAGIILDARVCGKLVDDRPPSAPVSALLDDLSKHVVQLKDLFKDHHPKQYTIEDSVHGDTRAVSGILPEVPRNAEGQEAAGDAQRRKA